jgi:DNA (cytosine-5)-methyltransferase 1
MKKATTAQSTGAYKFIDLFAGIGGFHLAFNRVGAKCVFVSEWDKYARLTYEENFKRTEPELFEGGFFAGDITKVEPKSIPDFDILAAGFPCQPFSHAGFKKGFADRRGTLFHNIVKIIEEKRPAAIFLENVSHLLKHDDGKTFEVIKNTIEKELGYSFHYKIVRASDFNLPQHRPRLFMVGFRDKSIPFSFPEPVPLTKTLSDIFDGECKKKIGYTLRVGGRGSGIHDRRNWDSYLVDGKVRTLTPKEGKKMMGFPDDFHFPVSKAQAMKQLGNSVAVNGIQAVADEIVKTLNNYAKRKQRGVERVLRIPKNTIGRQAVRSR